MNRRTWCATWFVGLAGLALVSQIILWTTFFSPRSPSSDARLLPAFDRIATTSSRSVVSITVARKVFDEANHATALPLADRTAEATGFFISAGGLIVTNRHVVASADRVLVHWTDAASSKRVALPAKLVGMDSRSDVALLSVDAPGAVSPVTLGNAKSLRLGQWVMAIGTPYGFEGTVSHGVIGALDRRLNGGSGSDPWFIQSDIPASPGYSGGPLFDLHGHVIGMTSQTYMSAQGGNAGLSFSIPIDEVMAAVKRIREVELVTTR